MRFFYVLILLVACEGGGKVFLEGGSSSSGDMSENTSSEQGEVGEDTAEVEPDESTASETSSESDTSTDTESTEETETDTQDSTDTGTTTGSETETETETQTETEDPIIDNDGDGFDAQNDCDDNDPAINPGATEICDGLDNDCDGTGDTEAVCQCNVESTSGTTYLFCTQIADWYSAESACNSKTNYQLVVIEDETENTWLQSKTSAIDGSAWWWMGYNNINAANNQEPAGGWEWSNGMSSSYSNWDNDQPDDWQTVEDCAHLYSNGTWNDLDCARDNWSGTPVYFICESTAP